MKENIKNQAIHWVACQKEGLNEFQKIRLESWLNENIEHKQAFDEAKKIYNIFQEMPKVYSKQLSIKAHKKIKKIKVIQTIKPLVGYAAIFIFLVMASLSTYNYYTPSFEKIYMTKDDNLRNELLPDGSKITLDTKSSVEVQYFANKRKVLLREGEAFFEVAKNKKRPFMISSGKTIITVVGTKFEVQKDDQTTTVTVEEGIVKIGNLYDKNKDSKTITRLKKGEKIIINDFGKISYLGKTTLKQIAPWREKILIFNKSSLEQAFKDFSRYNKIDVQLDTSVSKLLFSGKFKTNGLENFLSAIEKIYPLKIKRNKNKIFISKK